MNRSIKRFLLIYLLLTITIITTLMTIGNYYLDSNAIQKNFEAQLKQTVGFLEDIIGTNPEQFDWYKLQTSINQSTYTFTDEDPKDHIQFVVWNKDGRMVLHSQYAPSFSLSQITDKNGMETLRWQNNIWHIYIRPLHKNTDYTIMAAQTSNIQQNLLNQLTWSNLLMLLWGYPFFGLLIWLSVDRGLSSLKRIARDIANRHSAELKTVDITNAPLEVKPLIEALNKLFVRLEETFERNKRFSADAAHELRTPLAALKTQAQVALRAPSENAVKAGLKNVILGVDRCTHIVQQLLTLSRLEPEHHLEMQLFHLSNLAAEIVAQLAPQALEKNIEIELDSNDKEILMYANETAIAILIRNLVDNAIRYTPIGGNVKVYLQENEDNILIQVTDNGPGIPKELRNRVFERFYRVLGTQASGSGLGLAIVQQIVELHHAHIVLDEPPSGQGLEFSIYFPKYNTANN